MGSLRLKRGTSADRAAYTPLEGELILDTDTYLLYAGDGTTAGGIVVSGNISNINVSSSYGNVNVANYLPVYGGNISADVITANSVTGISFANLPAGNLTGTISSGVLGNSTLYIGTTAVALNRANAVLSLTGIDNVANGNSNIVINNNGNVIITANAVARVNAHTSGVDVTGTFSVSGNATVNGLTSNTFATVTGNLSAGNISTAGQINATGNVSADHVLATVISATGNVTGNYADFDQTVEALRFTSTTANLAPLTVNSSVMVTNLNAQFANVVTNPVQSNITQVGALSSLTVSGNLTGNIASFTAISGDGAGISNITGANVTGAVPLATTANVANTVTLTATDTANATHYLTFVNNATANSAVRTDTGLTYNPFTNTLSTANFNGLASLADRVVSTAISAPSDATNRPIFFGDNAAGGGQSNVFVQTANLYYTISTQRLTALGGFVGNVIGNVTGNLSGTADFANSAAFVQTNGNTSNNDFAVPFLTQSETKLSRELGVFTYNPGTDTLRVVNVASTGNIVGTVVNSNTSQIGTLTVTGNTSTANVFVGAANGSEGARRLVVYGNIEASNSGVSTSGTMIARLFRAPLSTKANNSTGTAGDIAWDTDYIYVCTATNTWKRVQLTAF